VICLHCGGPHPTQVCNLLDIEPPAGLRPGLRAAVEWHLDEVDRLTRETESGTSNVDSCDLLFAKTIHRNAAETLATLEGPPPAARPHGLDELEGTARHLQPNSLVLLPAKECLAMIEYIRKLESERTGQ
jgi:hypothetical protein